jgi:hypothetical protein
MRLALLTAAVALASVAAASSASAQVGFGVYVGPSGYYDDYEYAPPVYRSPRGYGYTSSYEYDSRPDVVVRTPGRRGGCGEYFYWDGTACVDARSNPPDLR